MQGVACVGLLSQCAGGHMCRTVEPMCRWSHADFMSGVCSIVFVD